MERGDKGETYVPGLSWVRLRRARGSDLASVIAIDAENTGVATRGYWSDRLEWCAAREPDRFFIVAERDETMLGFIVGEVRAWEFGSPPSGWIIALHVIPAARLHGVGTMLFEDICARFRRAGVSHVRTVLARDADLPLSFLRSVGMNAGPFIDLEMKLDGSIARGHIHPP